MAVHSFYICKKRSLKNQALVKEWLSATVNIIFVATISFAFNLSFLKNFINKLKLIDEPFV